MRLIQAACDVFAEKGYDDATVAEICARADANIAALNYHLGDKAAAYRLAYELSFEEGLSSHPFDLDSDASPMERLEAHIVSLLHRMNVDGNLTRFERIRNWESLKPSGLVDDIDHEVRKESRAHMLKCLAEIVGEEVPHEELLLAEALVLSMCRMVLPFNKHELALVEDRTIDEALLQKLTRRILDLVSGGLKFAVAQGAKAQG
ncbi:MAG: hypothetical protein RL268_2187 [Pseudomonadota bacterium]|jgi:AcrR family transcriptional regulator